MLPPFTELFVPFADTIEIDVRGKPLGLEWKSLGRDLAFRPQGAAPTVVWFYSNIPVAPKRPVPKARRDSLAKRLSLGYGRRDWKRIVPVPGQDLTVAPEYWLQIAPKMASVFFQDNKHGALWHAPLTYPGDKLAFFNAPIEGFSEQARQAIETNPTEWETAKEWAQWDDDTRFWSLISWRNGDEKEWKALLQALMVLEAHHNTPLFARWQIFAPAVPPTQKTAPLGLNRHNFPPSPNASDRLLTLAVEYFAPQVNFERSRIVSTFKISDILHPNAFTVQAPSHHDLLEAAQTWREWGRKTNCHPAVEKAVQALLNGNKAG